MAATHSIASDVVCARINWRAFFLRNFTLNMPPPWASTRTCAAANNKRQRHAKHVQCVGRGTRLVSPSIHHLRDVTQGPASSPSLGATEWEGAGVRQICHRKLELPPRPLARGMPTLTQHPFSYDLRGLHIYRQMRARWANELSGKHRVHRVHRTCSCRACLSSSGTGSMRTEKSAPEGTPF